MLVKHTNHVCYIRYGVVKFESVMRLRNKLEELGKMEGVNTKEKGLWKCGKVCITDWCCLSLQIPRSF